MPAADRRVVFISHANPEDNAAAAWFATQLTVLGYEVWCDIKNTHGGESGFWQKVQSTIENDAAKFVFILSDASRDFEKKRGVYKEVQAASNLNRDNFVIPVRIGKLSGSVPILIGTDIYINGENWAAGLRELLKRLREDKVPIRETPDYRTISSWWPALGVSDSIISPDPAPLTSCALPITRLPSNVHLLQVWSEGNLLAGHERLHQALPKFPPFSAFGDYAISFGNAADFQPQVLGFDVRDVASTSTSDFLAHGWPEFGVSREAAINMTTYFVATALEAHLATKRLSSKSVARSARKIWYPPKKLLPGDAQKRIKLVGHFSHFRKQYFWHFGFQPQVDLRTMSAVLLNPKAIITRPYNPDRSEQPFPIDDKKAMKGLGWWNADWRRRVVAISAWLSEGESSIKVAVGHQEILISAEPREYVSPKSYKQISDEEVLRSLIEGAA